MTASLLLAALLHLYPHAARRDCIRARSITIAAQAMSASEAHGVPVEIILAVGFSESAFGCDPRSGGSWGSPRDRQHRGIAGGADHQARDLATSMRVCGTWERALSRYRVGRCTGGHVVGYTPESAVRLAGRLRAAVASQ